MFKSFWHSCRLEDAIEYILLDVSHLILIWITWFGLVLQCLSNLDLRLVVKSQKWLLLCLIDLAIETSKSLLVHVKLIHQRLVDLFSIYKLLLDEKNFHSPNLDIRIWKESFCTSASKASINFLRWASKERPQRIRPAASGKFLM